MPAACGSKLPFLQQLAEHHVAHAEAECGKIDAAEIVQQRVVAPAAADRAELALGVEQLEHDAGVVREAAHDGEVDVDPVPDAERLQVRRDRS